MADKWKIEDEFLFGGDYNPDQWLDRPDVLEADLTLMKNAGISVVSLGIFAWSTLEPEEGKFEFDWMDRIIDNLHGAGVKVFLATPSGARPAWMAERYPEVLRVGPSGGRNLFGARHNHCFSSPVYREKVRIMNTRLAERYSSHPAVVLWHVSNEYSGDCHCELCQANFRAWLKERYKTLDALNKAWWTSFWSHTVTDWDQIHSPVPHGELSVHGLNLDWQKFTTHMTVDFMTHEVEALKSAGSDLPVTTNMMMVMEDKGMDPGLDNWKFREIMDYASWDSYPAWHMPGHKILIHGETPDEEADDYRRASEEAFHHDLYRSLCNGPFLLMESTPSRVNWQATSKGKRPGMNILAGMNAVSHGSNSVQYFQWRQGRGSFEKYHGAVVDQSGRDDTLVYRECAELGAMLKKIKPVAEAGYPARAALVYSWENRWALDDSQGPVNNDRKAYVETVRKHYYCLWKAGIPVDVISGEEDLSGYELVAAPMLYLTSRKQAENFRTYVEGGGNLLTTYNTGYVDETDLCFEGGSPGPLRDVLGLRVEDLDALHRNERIYLSMEEDYPVQDYYEIVRPEGAQVLARFRDPWHQDLPGFLVNSFGGGKAYHLAGRLDADSLYEVYQIIVSDREIRSNLDLVIEKSSELDIQIREKGDKVYLFVMNFSAREGSVVLKSTWNDFLEEGEAGDEWTLPPYGLKILTN